MVLEIPVVFKPAKPDYIDIIDARVEGDLADRGDLTVLTVRI